MIQTRRFHSFAEFREHVLSIYLDYYPTFGSTLGLHQYDGKTEDFSQPRREAYLQALLTARDTLDQDFNMETADPNARFEIKALDWKINDEIFRLTDLREYEWNPMVYNDQLEITHLLDRDYAPFEERIQSVIRRLRAYPRILAIARQNLLMRIDRTIVETGLMALDGRLSFLDSMPDLYFDQIHSNGLRDELAEAIQSARLAIVSFSESIRTVVLPTAMYDSFRLGADLLARFLKSSELVEEPLDDLLQTGLGEIDRMTVQLHKACESLDPHSSPKDSFHTYVESEHFSERTILKETHNMLERIRTFVVKNKIVDMPSDVRCKVEETPAHMRWAFAAMNSPGAFEQVATEAFYYLTLPDKDWDAHKKKEYLHSLNRSVLELISIHEAYPGHYTHFLHLQNIQSRVGKTFWSYAFIEGWAHYCEQMMLEAGWGDGDVRIEIAYLQEALIRLCRFVTALQLHRGNMTLSEAQHLFEEKALMRPVAARKEAERAVFDPGYLSYTLGKMQILELRAKMEKHKNFSLLHFHNELLSFGSAPIKIIGEMMGA